MLSHQLRHRSIRRITSPRHTRLGFSRPFFCALSPSGWMALQNVRPRRDPTDTPTGQGLQNPGSQDALMNVEWRTKGARRVAEDFADLSELLRTIATPPRLRVTTRRQSPWLSACTSLHSRTERRRDPHMRATLDRGRWPPVPKRRDGWRVVPHLADYERTTAIFTWEAARRLLDGLPQGRGLNIAHEAVTRHASGDSGARVAFRWIAPSGMARELTYAELEAWTNGFANVLDRLGVGKGDVVVTLAGRVPELYVAALGTLKKGAIFSPFFSAFGPEPIKARMNISRARVLVTTETLYRRKIEPQRSAMPELEHVLLIGESGAETTIPGTLDLGTLLVEADSAFTIPATDPQEPALLHFTSGTTGLPKGAIHVHEAVVAHHVTARYALDLHDDDVFWCTADPGWVTGTSYGLIAPLTNHVTSIVDEADFDAERWYRILRDERVTVWYTAPTAIRMMMKYGSALPRDSHLDTLRFLASVGEPLNPEAVMWGIEAFGLPFHDNWWQTETGGIMIANYASMEIRPGSMGRPLPGVEAAIVHPTSDGGVEVEDQADVEGELALRPGWPSMFRGYLGDEARYRKCFAGGYYLTGDLARRDADGYYWFVGRADDVIKSSGHLIGPFEVESALLEHPAVAEAGVIGKPDPVALEIVKAFVALKPGHEPTDELRQDLLGFARLRLGAAVAPKEIAFVGSIPKNRAGKIMRRLLKARELGLPEGDLSTLESS
jgi:acetyl-CoA synthetase